MQTINTSEGGAYFMVSKQLKHSAANLKVAWLEHWQGSINMPLVQDTRDRLT